MFKALVQRGYIEKCPFVYITFFILYSELRKKQGDKVSLKDKAKARTRNGFVISRSLNEV